VSETRAAQDSIGQAAGAVASFSRLAQFLHTSTGTSRIPPLDGLRGYAVFLVFLVHHHTLFSGYLQQDTWLFRASRFTHTIGNSGVDLFFVLSGYLIYGHLSRSAPSYATFVVRRVRRIYPTFLAIFAIYVLLSYLMPGRPKLPATPTAQIVYLAANCLFLPGILPIEPLITVAWSLSYEFLFYLTIPLILAVSGMRRWRRWVRVAVFVTAIAAYGIGSQLGIMPHVRMIMFFAGIVAYEMVDSGWGRRTTSAGLEIALLVFYSVVMAALGLVRFGADGTALQPSVPAVWPILLSLALCGLVVYATSFDGLIRRFFSAPAARSLGNISYSYFLVHGLVLNGLAWALREIFLVHPHLELPFVAIFTTSLLLTAAAAMIVFLAVEKPFSLAGKHAPGRLAHPPASHLAGEGGG
jgi:peptidoglycan/LPS O-acetylase OafA/YrhL